MALFGSFLDPALFEDSESEMDSESAAQPELTAEPEAESVIESTADTETAAEPDQQPTDAVDQTATEATTEETTEETTQQSSLDPSQLPQLPQLPDANEIVNSYLGGSNSSGDSATDESDTESPSDPAPVDDGSSTEVPPTDNTSTESTTNPDETSSGESSGTPTTEPPTTDSAADPAPVENGNTTEIDGSTGETAPTAMEVPAESSDSGVDMFSPGSDSNSTEIVQESVQINQATIDGETTSSESVLVTQTTSGGTQTPAQPMDAPKAAKPDQLIGSGCRFDEALLPASLKGWRLQDGADQEDQLIGTRKRDLLRGYEGNDVLDGRKGNDWLWGGCGEDRLIGGGGANRFGSAKDGESDQLWISREKTGVGKRSRVDLIEGLDRMDSVVLLGAKASSLTFAETSHRWIDGGEYSGIGIFAKGQLQALYTGGDLSLAELQAITSVQA